MDGNDSKRIITNYMLSAEIVSYINELRQSIWNLHEFLNRLGEKHQAIGNLFSFYESINQVNTIAKFIEPTNLEAIDKVLTSLNQVQDEEFVYYFRPIQECFSNLKEACTDFRENIELEYGWVTSESIYNPN